LNTGFSSKREDSALHWYYRNQMHAPGGRLPVSHVIYEASKAVVHGWVTFFGEVPEDNDSGQYELAMLLDYKVRRLNEISFGYLLLSLLGPRCS